MSAVLEAAAADKGLSSITLKMPPELRGEEPQDDDIPAGWVRKAQVPAWQRLERQAAFRWAVGVLREMCIELEPVYPQDECFLLPRSEDVGFLHCEGPGWGSLERAVTYLWQAGHARLGVEYPDRGELERVITVCYAEPSAAR